MTQVVPEMFCSIIYFSFHCCKIRGYTVYQENYYTTDIKTMCEYNVKSANIFVTNDNYQSVYLYT